MMLSVWAVEGLPEFTAGDDVAELISAALDLVTSTGSVHRSTSSTTDGTGLQDGDILAITSKIISKAEGRSINATDREDAITSQTVRLVASRTHPGGVTRIVENPLGLVLAAAGVDASNTPDGTVLLLPVDPDASARAIAEKLRERFGVALGVIITDTLGRPWRTGQTDVAIGAAGVRVLDDLRGSTDANGKRLDVTAPAVADEIAAAADLVKGKASGNPVAVVRGLAHLVTDLNEPGARSLVRPSDEDMFRLGSAEAYAEGLAAGRAVERSAERAGRGETRESEG
jgi:coenzyme F420-0:L-glutamate ligase/coenzyme F420-1:gamma-L-glutamate ligase